MIEKSQIDADLSLGVDVDPAFHQQIHHLEMTFEASKVKGSDVVLYRWIHSHVHPDSHQHRGSMWSMTEWHITSCNERLVHVSAVPARVDQAETK